MSFLGNMTQTEEQAKKAFTRLTAEVRKGKLAAFKVDLLLTNPDEFLSEYLTEVDEDERAEVAGIIKQIIITGFFRMQQKAGRAEAAEGN